MADPGGHLGFFIFCTYFYTLFGGLKMGGGWVDEP